MKKLLLTTFIIGACMHLWAQEASPKGTPPVLPPGPLLNRAPEFAQWTVTFKFSSEKPKAGEKAVVDQRDTQTVVTKTKTRYHLSTVNGAGARSEIWSLGDVQIAIVPNAQYPVLSTPGSGVSYVNFSKQDFFGFGWNSAKNFVGIQTVLGNDCLVFKDKIKMPTGPEFPDLNGQPSEMVDAVAVIIEKSRLPVALQLGETVTTYQYGSPPTAMLVPPADVQQLADKWQNRVRQAALMPPP